MDRDESCRQGYQCPRRDGQKLIVKAGEKVASDGQIVEGSTELNESMLTGESIELKKGPGDQVVGGSVNGSGTITIQVTATGEEGYLSQVMTLVKKAQDEKSDLETESDTVARYLFFIASSVGIGALIVCYLLTKKGLNLALEKMVTVLIIACPHALGLAVPLVIARFTSLGASNGLIIKNRNVIEDIEKLKYVLMDKTGTLTEGNFGVNEIRPTKEGYDEKDILKILASLESGSSHPLALGILREVEDQSIDYTPASDIQTLVGTGLEGKLNSKTYKLVNPAYLRDQSIDYDQDLEKNLASQGNYISYLLEDGELVGLVAQGDEIKEGSKVLVDRLIQKDIKPVMLTRDNQGVAEKVGAEVGIEDIQSELKTEDKEKIVKSYNEKGLTMMVGNGVNNAPALARAGIGVAIGAGTDVAIESADIILVKSKPLDIINFIELARKTQRKLVQNLWWGAGYNIIAIPLAAGILSPWGIDLSPAFGAILMWASTLIVASNAMTLKMK